jgi:hypothetical protein
MDGVACELRIGDMTLHATHSQIAGERPAAATAAAIAEPLARRWLADQAGIDLLPVGTEMFGDLADAVDRFGLLVTGQQQPDRTGMPRLPAHKSFERDDHRRDAAFHVGTAAPEQLAVADSRLMGWRRPGPYRAGRHHVGVP